MFVNTGKYGITEPNVAIKRPALTRNSEQLKLICADYKEKTSKQNKHHQSIGENKADKHLFKHYTKPEIVSY